MQALSLEDAVQGVMDAIADRSRTQIDIADAYALAIEAGLYDRSYQWPEVNRAILARYSPYGLKRIKNLAWRRWASR